MALADDARWLFVANQRSGTISIIDTATLKPAGEVKVGRKLADLAAAPDGSYLVAADEEAGEVLFLRRRGPQLSAPTRVKVSPYPVSVQIAADGSCCSIASLWSRRITVVSLPRRWGWSPDHAPASATPQHIVKTIGLSFAPRLQFMLRDVPKVIVADSFGGRLAVIDLTRGVVESNRIFPAHNIRGLALSADGSRLLVSHQMLNRQGTTSRDDLRWGNLITNVVRELPLKNVLNAKADLLGDSRVIRLGDTGRGAGDPAGVAARGDKLLVVLAGVGEVAIGSTRGDAWQRLGVGRRPTAIALSPDGKRAYVANTFADTISALDLETKRVLAEVMLGPKAEATSADRGEMLFYDAGRSLEGWFSCHSCHTDGHSNGLLADTLGDGSYGTPKRVLSLLGVKDTGPWAWNGSMSNLEKQVRNSIATTMQGVKLTHEQESDLLAYLQTLAPAPALGSFRQEANDASVIHGRDVFQRQGCSRCHAPPTYTSAKTHDVWSGGETGNMAFSPPSLRGISQAGPYFHDGRALTLVDVFTRYRHQLKGELSNEEVTDLIAFLEHL